MITDRVPKEAIEREEYARSDEMRRIALPPEEPLHSQSLELEVALVNDHRTAVSKICKAMAADFADYYEIPTPKISVLGARPLEVNEDTQFELFGDYHFEKMRIRLWMRTAVHQRPTAFGTFLSTFVHELCHHLDVVGLDLPNTFHTRGFYERAGLVYHQIRDTPVRPLVWVPLRGGLYRIDWARTMRR